MKDPYEVLGVGRDAPLDEIKKTYRDLARKYHPDNYVGNDLADLAQEKMKDINEAYDTIIKQRENGGGSYDSGRYGGNPGGGSAAYAQVRQAIMNGNIALAQSLLDAMDSRDAEWHFLYGAVMYRKGWYDEAARHTRQAADMDPGNAEYRSAADQMSRGPGGYRQNPYGGGGGGGCSACDCCAAMACADCLCRGC